nr:hypothetical protein B0A51_00063 [Rachicladosporium sp. CCFEE 5018]
MSTTSYPCEPYAEPNPETVQLLAALRKEADRQQDVTPSLVFSDSPSDAHVYDLVCEAEHAKYSSPEIERRRAKIDSQRYWELEVDFLKTALMDKIETMLRQKHVKGTSTDAKALRAIASEYKRKLQRQGCTSSQIRERRKTIKDRKYWEIEANHLFRQLDTKSQGITLIHMDLQAPEDIVVLLKSRPDTKLRFLSDNAAYSCEQPRHASDNEHPNEKEYDIFALRFMGKQPYAHIGWVFGSSNDAEICDFQIAAGNGTGISRQHFKICMTETTSPGIQVLSKNPIHLTIDAKGLDEDDTTEPRDTVLHEEPEPRKLLLHKQPEPWPIIRNVKISVGLPPIHILIWRPLLPTAEQRMQYFDKATRMQRAVRDATPSPSCLGTRASDTPMIRDGANDKLYIMTSGTGRRGGSGSVEMVIEQASQRIFAAKVLNFSSSASVSVAKKNYDTLLREFTRMQVFDAPYIVHAIDLIASPSPSQPAWLVMEWMEHELKPKDLPREDRTKLFEHIGEGLGFIHDKGFVHHDIKPANIMVHMDFGRLVIAKLIDFGICSTAEAGSRGKIKGTGPYLAPELWSSMASQRDVVQNGSNAVDMWAFGITAVECLSAWCPSEDELWKKAARFWPPPEAFSLWLQEFKDQRVPFKTSAFGELLEGLLCDDPTERWHASSVRTWLADHPGVRDERRITDTIDDDDGEL